MGNGLGPWWFPDWLRARLTQWADRRYPSLSWQMHDISYDLGHPARWICDRGFLRAMLQDAMRAQRVAAIWGLSLAAWLFWVAVRLGGHWSYNRHARRQTG